jgi:hypothetical protein
MSPMRFLPVRRDGRLREGATPGWSSGPIRRRCRHGVMASKAGGEVSRGALAKADGC